MIETNKKLLLLILLGIVIFSFTVVADTCKDMDGVDYKTASYVLVTYSAGGSSKSYDYCADDDTLAEYICSGSEEDLKIKNCKDFGSDYICDFGKCDTEETPPPDICTEEIFYNPPDSYLQKGTVATKDESKTDYCPSYTHLIDYHCSNGDGKQGKIVENVFDCGVIQGVNEVPMKCNDGRCIEGDIPMCSDSDNGKEPKIKGTVSMNLGESVSDTCLDNDKPSTSGNELTEYYCIGTESYGYKIYDCQCSDGKCIDDPKPKINPLWFITILIGAVGGYLITLKKDKKQKITGILVGGVIGFVISIILISSGFTAQKNQVECVVTISNPLGTMKIDSATCQIKDSCLFSMTSLGIITDKGVLELNMGNSVGKVDVNVPEFSSRSYTVSTCTDSKSGNLNLKDKNGGIIDSKNIGVDKNG